jgi:acyl carrier protein|tara:strand:+ start:12320 stop:12535 length:216 start_codon:yes stop_codon:yes gene_type:complete
MIEKIIAEQLDINIDEVTDNKHLMNDLGADSLDTVQLVMEIEEAYDLEISDEDAETLETVGAIKKYIGDNT